MEGLVGLNKHLLIELLLLRAFEIPKHLIEQLDEGGIMIVPVGEVMKNKF